MVQLRAVRLYVVGMQRQHSNPREGYETKLQAIILISSLCNMKNAQICKPAWFPVRSVLEDHPESGCSSPRSSAKTKMTHVNEQQVRG
jgi:hypothetical protein